MHLNVYWWLHLVRGSAEMTDEVGTCWVTCMPAMSNKAAVISTNTCLCVCHTKQLKKTAYQKLPLQDKEVLVCSTNHFCSYAKIRPDQIMLHGESGTLKTHLFGH